MKDRISPLAALIAFAIATMILAQGITAPFVKDAEPQAASWIQDFASGDHLLIPRDYYGELARKPPLFYWIAGAITAATGGRVDEVRARIVSVVAAATIALTVLMWTAEFLGQSTGWLAFLFLLGSYAFTSRGTLALEDMTLTAFMFAAWCMLYPALDAVPSRRRIIATGIAFGLGMLTKGPIAIVLPAFGAMIYLLITRRSLATQLRQGWPWMVLAVAVLIALPWYIAALLSNRGELARIIFQENAGHFLPASAGGTGEAARPFYYIAMKLIGGSAPLNFLLPALIVALIRGEFAAEARRPLMFQLSFVLAMLIFFSLASAKRDDYVLPGVPSLAILLAALFTALGQARAARILREVAAIIVAAFAIASLAAVWRLLTVGNSSLLARASLLDRAQAQTLARYYVGALGLIFIAAGLAVAGCAALIISGVLRKHPVRTAAGIGTLSLLGVLIYTAVMRPEMSRERTLKYAAADIARVADDAPVYVIRENEELAFYLRRKAPQIVGAHHAIMAAPQPAYLFAYPEDFRGPAVPLRDRIKLVQQWDRLSKAGPPALYEIQPEGLKAPAEQDK